MKKFSLKFLDKKIDSDYEALFYSSKRKLFTLSLVLLSLYGFSRFIEAKFTKGFPT